jgi:hypothetical protein
MRFRHVAAAVSCIFVSIALERESCIQNSRALNMAFLPRSVSLGHACRKCYKSATSREIFEVPSFFVKDLWIKCAVLSKETTFNCPLLKQVLGTAHFRPCHCLFHLMTGHAFSSFAPIAGNAHGYHFCRIRLPKQDWNWGKERGVFQVSFLCVEAG